MGSDGHVTLQAATAISQLAPPRADLFWTPPGFSVPASPGSSVPSGLLQWFHATHERPAPHPVPPQGLSGKPENAQPLTKVLTCILRRQEGVDKPGSHGRAAADGRRASVVLVCNTRGGLRLRLKTGYVWGKGRMDNEIQHSEHHEAERGAMAVVRMHGSTKCNLIHPV